MGFRFRRSVKIAPGVRVNLSKRGASLSVGGHGMTTNISQRGVRQTVGIPGTGLSYSRMLGKGKRKPVPSREPSAEATLPIEPVPPSGGEEIPAPPGGPDKPGRGRKFGIGCGGLVALILLLAVCSNLTGGGTHTLAPASPLASPMATAVIAEDVIASPSAIPSPSPTAEPPSAPPSSEEPSAPPPSETPPSPSEAPAQPSAPEPSTAVADQAPPAQSAAPASAGVVHPGAFCSSEGATGVTVDGTPMVCSYKRGDTRARWRAS